MKRIFAVSLSVILFVAILILDSCIPKQSEKAGFAFAGNVYDTEGKPLPNVLVQVQDKEATTNDEGFFRVIELRETNPYVLNASLLGYGFVSKVYRDTSTHVRITMAKAKVTPIDLGAIEGDSVSITDTSPSFSTPLSAGSPAGSNPLSAIPFVYDSAGRLIGFEMPAPLQATYDAINNFRPPVLGARLVFPKEGLELQGDGRKIDVSLQTIDLYAPDGMPGDYTVRLENQQRGFMRTYGAANIDIFQDGKPVQLKKGYQARVIIPVDTLSILTKEKLAGEIPFLVYNRATGEWEQEGMAVLNRSRTAYEASTSHFSSFNMDMVFGAAASCYKVCNEISTATFPNQKIEISVPSKSKLLDVGAPCASPGNCTTNGAGTGAAHGIINLEPYTPVGVKMFNGTTLLSTHVFVTGGSSINQNCDFNACHGPVVTTNTLDQRYVNGTSTGMCHALLAAPQKRLDVAGPPYTVKVAWLYDNDFAVNASPALTFDVQVSNTEDFAATLVNLTNYNPPGTVDIINSYEFAAAQNSASYYFRVRPTGSGDWSNVVCITFDSMGNTPSTCTSAIVPSNCM
ncbi:MAG: hypothetical protein ACOYXT_07075 [Bacteroidota bacterium]